MNKMRLLLMIMLLAIVGSLNAQTYEATIEQSISGGFLDVSLFLRHTGTTSPILGNCSFYVSFNNSALSVATLQSDGQWDDTYHTGYGQNMVNTSQPLGLASIEVVKSGTPTYQIPDVKTHLGTIRFTITDPSQNSGIQWNTNWTEVFDVNNVGIKGDGTFINPGEFSLPVELSLFTAEAGDGEVTLRWVTESEVNNLGFYIWRSLEEKGTYVRLPTELIPGAGNSPCRHDYEYVDKSLTNGVTYWYKLEDIDYSGKGTMHGPIAASPRAESLPDSYALSVNYPNPFNPQTVIKYQLPKTSQVRLTIYNSSGQVVKTIVDEAKQAGFYWVIWDGWDDAGKKVASGVYLYELRAGDFAKVRKMALIR